MYSFQWICPGERRRRSAFERKAEGEGKKKRREKYMSRLLFTRAGKSCGEKMVSAGSRCNRTPIKATPIVARNEHCDGIIVRGEDVL